MLWIEFLAAAVLIVVSGYHLTRAGDVIAEATGISRGFIGVVLLALVTSLPELITSVSAVITVETSQGADLAVGNVMGSILCNLMLIAILDIIHTSSTSFLSEAGAKNIFAAILSSILIATLVLTLSMGRAHPAAIMESVFSFVLTAGCFASIYLVFRCESRYRKECSPGPAVQSVSLSRSIILFVFFSAMVIGSAIWLSTLGDRIALHTGLSHTFVGSLFLACVTSMPELVVSVSALKLGSSDMALGNLCGSNIFNICIVPVVGLFYRGEMLYHEVSVYHLITGCGAIMMTGIVITSIIYRSKRQVLRIMGWGSCFLLVLYGGIMYYLARFS